MKRRIAIVFLTIIVLNIFALPASQNTSYAESNSGDISWTMNLDYEMNRLVGGTYANNMFIAIGTNGTIKSSRDGIDWEDRDSGVTNDLYSVTWNGTEFLAVGIEGTITSSNDGINWTKKDVSISSDLIEVVWADTQYVALGYRGSIFTSPDGNVWTKRREGTETDHLNGIVWNGDKFMAVGYEGIILISDDGIAWEKTHLSGRATSEGVTYVLGDAFNFIGRDYTDIAWGNGLFVMPHIKGGAFVSSDGINWTHIWEGIEGIGTIIWSDGKFITSGTNSISISEDGINWTNKRINIDGAYYVPMSSDNLMIAVGMYERILSSPDGNQWTLRNERTSNLIQGGLSDVIWHNDQYIAIGSGGQILTSPDGDDWTFRESGTNESLWEITWGNNQYIAVGSDGTILTSSDGINWTKQASGLLDSYYATSLYDIVWNGEQFVAVGAQSTILTSPDGVNWTIRRNKHPDQSYDFGRVLWYDNRFIAFGSTYSLGSVAKIELFSSDGISWDEIQSENPFQRIEDTGSPCSNGEIIISIGGYGRRKYSYDGIEWYWIESPHRTNFQSIVWDGNRFLAFGTDPETSAGIVEQSYDGLTWTIREDEMAPYITNLIWANNQYLGVRGTRFIKGVKIESTGDFNGDGITDIYDLVILGKVFNTTSTNPNWDKRADVNNDNIVDSLDLKILIQNYHQ